MDLHGRFLTRSKLGNIINKRPWKTSSFPESWWTKVCCIVLFPSKEPWTIGGHLCTLDYIQKLKRPLRIPPKRTKPHKFSQIISQKIGKIGKIDYPISDSSKGLGNTKRPIQHTLVHQLSGETPFIMIHQLVWAWKGVRHRVSDSVFKVTRIIE